MLRYSKEVLRHFTNPNNAGEIEDADGIGELGDPACGVFMRLHIKVESDRLADVKYQITGLSWPDAS